jgi:two-component system, NtrC family, C4-dicarboxylate transport sensor histidine kinase DctB
MVASSKPAVLGGSELEDAVREITQVLLAAARGDYSARAVRTYKGDPLDVLAFMVNSTAEEISNLMQQLALEREQLQQTRDQLLVAAKLSALGQLAAGVAHELNQPLTAIRMLLDMISSRPDAQVKDCQEDLDTMAEAARRMGRIVDSVRTFGRPDPLKARPSAPALPLEDALKLLADAFEREGIRIERRIAADLPMARIDVDGLHQVFVNLLTNARDALRDLPPGVPKSLLVAVTQSENGIRYCIEDNGPGVSREHAQRIFDPFFTTKEVGAGTGLGLSVSHGIVTEHGGTLRYEGASAGGARFVVELPVLQQEHQ